MTKDLRFGTRFWEAGEVPERSTEFLLQVRQKFVEGVIGPFSRFAPILLQVQQNLVGPFVPVFEGGSPNPCRTCNKILHRPILRFIHSFIRVLLQVRQRLGERLRMLVRALVRHGSLAIGACCGRLFPSFSISPRSSRHPRFLVPQGRPFSDLNPPLLPHKLGVQLGVDSSRGQQFGVGSPLHNPSMVQD